ncbi:peptide chain release factor N(5)-glutamine methyltransferase [Chondromyces apiculatus]|uniref:Release factor glutamine methyltransferase n=1 Tax=Chondromyces apiculatus DSM 436 TaxID=1192034 RepID=A0A017SV96_9BACT|nr:peptide chain release factor N(5)-glutamine methyltransferase [Chondromyces apiculatus]EYF00913.1 Methylase of polypeptide chain release factor [Chondromyces apiculatus DSM 436]
MKEEQGSKAAEGGGEAWTIRRMLTWSADDLKKRGSASPRLDAELLLGKVLGMSRVQMVIDPERPLQKSELSTYKALHQRRRAGEPVAYLLGVREFYGRTYRVDHRVLVPRPDTEILVEVGLARTRDVSLCARVLDLCTGSGCVAISLGKERPTTRVLGADLSGEALTVARENALRLGAVNVGFMRTDLFARVPRKVRFDLITANPPYISDEDMLGLPPDIREYEPRMALEGGPDGLDVARRIIAEAPRWLEVGGVLAMEVGAGQAPDTAALFERAGFGEIQRTRDLGGHERVVSGVRT